MFMHPEEQAFVNPYLLKDLELAAERIEKAIAIGQRICIYGDFDADGICATAIIFDLLKHLGADVLKYIPLRQDGYGLNMNAVQLLHDKGVKLLITVDNGVSAFEEIAECQRLGMDVVVLDHHKCHDTLPNCSAVVCASRESYNTRWSDLCGAAVAFKLCCALDEAYSMRYLPLVAVATVADVVRLNGENRMLIKKGLQAIKDNIGLKALLQVAGGDKGPITETTIAFLIAPRLNASGRMGDAMTAVDLLLAKSWDEALKLATLLDELNTQRRAEEQRIWQSCQQMLGVSFDKPIIILHDDNWNAGVIGIVASRLCEQHSKPVILFTKAHDGSIRGSGRSVEGIDLFELLQTCKHRFIRFGGHSKAAGISMELEQLDGFCQDVYKMLLGKQFYPNYYYEDEIDVEDCTVEATQALMCLAPFGEGNEEPVFLIRGCGLSKTAAIGKDGKHLSAMVEKMGHRKRIVGFGFGNRVQELQDYDCVDILCKLKVNSFRGSSSCELQLVAIRPSQAQA